MNKKKKIIIAVFALMCVAGAVSWYLLYGNPSILENAQEKTKDDIIGMYGSTESYIFYPADEELDVSTVREYMELDRQMHYTYGAETIAVTETDVSSYGGDVKFFFDYFATVIDGDYTKYNTLFTEDYFKNNEKTCDFTPQMLYDIYIEKLSEETKGGATVYGYNVSYKIFRNNGTFRNDIGSDGSKTLYFTLTEQNGTVLIDSIDYYV